MNMEMDIVFPGGGEDEPVNAILDGHVIRTGGGEPSPFDLFLVSIGTCSGVRVLRFCQERGIPTDKVRIRQRMFYNADAGRFEKIELDIQLPPDFPAKYRDAVVRAANGCGVKKHLLNPPEFDVHTSVIPPDELPS